MSTRIFRYSVKEPSFSLIKNGLKKIEGRLYKNTFCEINNGDLINFYNKKNNFTIKVIKVTKYKNFKDMLVDNGINIVTPLSKSLDESLSIYRNIYTVKDEEKYGVIAIELDKIL